MLACTNPFFKVGISHENLILSSIQGCVALKPKILLPHWGSSWSSRQFWCWQSLSRKRRESTTVWKAIIRPKCVQFVFYFVSLLVTPPFYNVDIFKGIVFWEKHLFAFLSWVTWERKKRCHFYGVYVLDVMIFLESCCTVSFKGAGRRKSAFPPVFSLYVKLR